MYASIRFSNGTVELSLHPMNTYTIIRQNGNVQNVVIAHIPAENLENTMTMILDHEEPKPNSKFIIEQD